MGGRITPMMHVPDVRAAALWYEAIGFELEAWHLCDAPSLGAGPAPDGALDWALLRWGASALMLNAGGAAREARRRDFDLYIDLDPAHGGVDALHARLKDKAEIVEAPYNAFHGNRELIVRDLNGFWITFAEPIPA